jgi:predicted TIM-barrel fold metal-dependent hydrolase
MAERDHFSGRIDEAWLASHVEEILEPGLPIVDPHHHLWDRPGNVYMLPELVADLASGHAVKATVFEECHSMYRIDGPVELRSLGETEFVTGVAAMSASGGYGPARACAAMVGNIDLMRGGDVARVLELHIAASGGRFSAVRYSTAWHPSESVPNVVPDARRLAEPLVRQGLACLERRNVAFDAWVFHNQIDEVADVAAAFPGLTIVLCHFGSPVLGGPNAKRQDEVFLEWRESMRRLSVHKNVRVKLGALPVRRTGPGKEAGGPPLSSTDIATAWRAYVDVCLDLFGAGNCMFESNFPVQKRWCSYPVFWNACKKLASGASSDEKAALFAGTAARTYRIPAGLV